MICVALFSLLTFVSEIFVKRQVLFLRKVAGDGLLFLWNEVWRFRDEVCEGFWVSYIRPDRCPE